MTVEPTTSIARHRRETEFDPESAPEPDPEPDPEPGPRGPADLVGPAQALAALPAGTWTVFHDVRWPGRPRARIDHVVVGPSGVFVIDAKSWSGRISLTDGMLRQNGCSRENDVESVTMAALDVAQLVPHLERRLVRPVLCFDGGEIQGTTRAVTITSTADLVPWMVAGRALLNEYQVRSIELDLAAGLRAASDPPVPLPARSPRPGPTRLRAQSGSAAPPARSAATGSLHHGVASVHGGARTLAARALLAVGALAASVGVLSATHTLNLLR